jgi:hypothetical protein
MTTSAVLTPNRDAASPNSRVRRAVTEIDVANQTRIAVDPLPDDIATPSSRSALTCAPF